MYKAVFIDLDGTLLRQDHSISEETRRTIDALVQKNVLVVLVSARPYHGIKSISEWLGISQLPIVSLNGAYIALGDNIIFESGIDTQTISRLKNIAGSFQAILIYYSRLKWFAEAANAAVEKEQKITKVPVIIAPFEDLKEQWERDASGLNKIMAIGEEDVIATLESRLVPVFGNEMNIYTSKPTYLEIMKKDASKTNAVKFLLDRYRFTPDQIIAIGDNFNDKEMIAFAGTGIAMGNAPDAIKAVADFVTDTNESDGVRKALEKFFP